MTTIHPAQTELVALAAAARGGDWARDLEGALALARTTGWDWPRAGAFACRLIFTEEGSPQDLRHAARNPLDRGPAGVPPVAEFAEARAALAARPRAVTPTGPQAALAQAEESRRDHPAGGDAA